jgi:protein-S-isoprenylcysteine O-methyltransferase Ste14
MSLTNKWINTIYKTATGSEIIKNIISPVGGIIFLSFVTGMILLSLYLDKVFEFSGFISFPYDLIFGFVLLFPGMILTGSCIFIFFKSKGTPVPLNPPQKLVVEGPYIYSRNPMLTGMFLLMFGLGFICNSIVLTFIFTPLLVLVNYIELKKIEEPELEMRLGKEYIEYKKNVSMFIPNIKHKLKN